MRKLHTVVKETLLWYYNSQSIINVIMFGRDEEVEQMISDYPSAYFLALSDATHYAADVIICTENVTKEEIDDISDLVRIQLADTVIVEESEGGALSTIHQNKYEHFTYLDDNTPNIIVYSKTADVTSTVGSCLGIFSNYTGFYASGVSTQSAPLTNVPFTIVGGAAPLVETDDFDYDLFDFDNKGDDN